MKMSLNKIIFWFNFTMITFGSLAILYFYFIDGSFSPEIDIASLHTVKSTYHRGETVQIISDFCKMRSSPVRFQWTLIDDDMPPITYGEKTITGLAKGCYDKRVSNIEIIPKYIVPGQYHFENKVTYQINPVRTANYVIDTNNFTIE